MWKGVDRMKRRAAVIGFVCILFAFTSLFPPLLPRAEAAISVIDVSNLAKIIQQLSVMDKQLKKLEEGLKHLLKIKVEVFAKVKAGLSGVFDKLSDFRSKIKGLAFDYSKVDEVWKSTYKSTDDLRKMQDREFADHLRKLDEETSKALYDAMKAQCLIEEIDKDKELLEMLMDESYQARGMLEAMQIGNKINSLQMMQLARMQVIMAASYRAQTMYYQWEMQEKMSQRVYVERNRIQMDNPIQKAAVAGFPKF